MSETETVPSEAAGPMKPEPKFDVTVPEGFNENGKYKYEPFNFERAKEKSPNLQIYCFKPGEMEPVHRWTKALDVQISLYNGEWHVTVRGAGYCSAVTKD